MAVCKCGRGYTLKQFTDEPKLDALCPICILATTPKDNEKEEYTCEELEAAYERDMNNSFIEEKEVSCYD